MYKLILTIFFTLYSLLASANQNTFSMYIDSISLNKEHVKEYLGIDMNVYDRDVTKTIDKNDPNFPFYASAFRYLERELKIKGYKMTDLEKFKLGDGKALFPISIGIRYKQSVAPFIFYVGIRGQEHAVPNQKNLQLTKEDLAKWVAKKGQESPMFFYEPLWTISLLVKNELPQHSELLLISMIKCAAPYFNKNFKGVVTCKR